MGYYINKQGIVIEALQWDGSKKNRKEIENKIGPFGLMEKTDYHFYGTFAQPVRIPCDYFKAHFKPLTDARVLLAEQFKKQMLIELEVKQQKGDDWLEYSLDKLMDNTREEFNEVAAEVYKFTLPLDGDKPDTQALIQEAAHLGICAAFLVDKAQKMELDAMWESKEKDE
jgi:hypothetical protein